MEASRVPDDDGVEMALAGGLGSGGSVIRIGSTVRRPERFFSASVRSFLRHLHQVGFTAAPEPFGVDADGREMLSFIDGDVGVPPFPGWVGDETLLVDVARLQRKMHTAAAGYFAPPDAQWDRANLPSPPADAIVCHNDLCIENVVVRDGRVVGFIDFDFAAPNDPLIDVAITLRHWLPARDAVDLDPELRGLDRVRRFRVFCDAYGLSVAERARVLDEIGRFLDRAMTTMQARHDAGMPGYVEVWRNGYPEQNRRSAAWVRSNASALIAPTV